MTESIDRQAAAEEEANNLERLRILADSVNDTARMARTAIVLVLIVALYLTFILLATSDEKLLRDAIVVLPQMETGISLKASYAVAPVVFFYLHIQSLFLLSVLCRKVLSFRDEPKKLEINKEKSPDSKVLSFRDEPKKLEINKEKSPDSNWLSAFGFVQIFWNPDKVAYPAKLIAIFNIIVVPLVLLSAIQLSFIRFQSPFITGIHFTCLLLDLLAIVWFSPYLTWNLLRDFKKLLDLLMVAALTITCFSLFKSDVSLSNTYAIVAGMLAIVWFLLYLIGNHLHPSSKRLTDLLMAAALAIVWLSLLEINPSSDVYTAIAGVLAIPEKHWLHDRLGIYTVIIAGMLAIVWFSLYLMRNSPQSSKKGFYIVSTLAITCFTLWVVLPSDYELLHKYYKFIATGIAGVLMIACIEEARSLFSTANANKKKAFEPFFPIKVLPLLALTIAPPIFSFFTAYHAWPLNSAIGENYHSKVSSSAGAKSDCPPSCLYYSEIYGSLEPITSKFPPNVTNFIKKEMCPLHLNVSGKILLRSEDNLPETEHIETLVDNNIDDVKKLVIRAHGLSLRERIFLCANLSSAWLNGADLRYANLSSANFTLAELRYADLTSATLTRADLTDAELRYADLTSATLTRATLTRATLTSATLTSATLTDADLTGADLTGANLTCANLTGADLTDAILTGAIRSCVNWPGADLSDADLTGADLTFADLTSATLTRADLTDADLTFADLTGAYLPDANLTGANLTGAYLTGAYLADADLPHADLTNVDLTHAGLSDANLTGANLTFANLTFADLTFADLTSAGLTNANLTGANLSGANLTDADLPYANLTGANLTDANLTDADLPHADLTNADLTHAGLSDANLTGANLTFADLTFAGLTSANLTDADLPHADLTFANLTFANLTFADLTFADLTDADLTGAYLAGAYLADADLADADLIRTTLTDADLTGAYLADADLTGAYLADADLIRTTLTDADLTDADLTGAYLVAVVGEPRDYTDVKLGGSKIGMDCEDKPVEAVKECVDEFMRDLKIADDAPWRQDILLSEHLIEFVLNGQPVEEWLEREWLKDNCDRPIQDDIELPCSSTCLEIHECSPKAAKLR